MKDSNDLFSRFRSKPSFFENYAERTHNAGLKRKLEEVLGPLDNAQFDELRPLAENNFDHAVSTYLDRAYIKPETGAGTQQLKRESTPDSSEQLFVDEFDSTEPYKEPELTSGFENSIAVPSKKIKTENGNYVEKEPEKEVDKDKWVNGKRFLGSIQLDAWCTRSGRDLALFGEKLSIHCTRGDLNIVRLVNSRGIEFARVREEDAKYMAPLIVCNVLSVDSTVIFAESRLNTGSSVFIQADCYLIYSAFTSSLSTSSNNSSASTKTKRAVDESKETKEEKLVRLRQSALVALLAKLDFVESETKQGEESSEELSAQQLDAFYKGAVGDAMDEAEPASSFALQLFPYQKRGLAWMLRREEIHVENDDEGALHPLWTELHWRNGDVFYANLASGELSLEKPTVGTRSRGGILADEMGLGKTISTLALIHTAVGESRRRSTLIVAPMSLLAQWESEIIKSNKTSRELGCFVYYGASQSLLTAQLSAFLDSAAYDRKIVLTTYGTVVSEHKQLKEFAPDNDSQPYSGAGIYGVEFDRIILDEAHTIKNRTTQTAMSCFDLRGKRRWALTGTPVVNRLEDLFSLIKFIQIEPWDNFTFWRAFVTDRFERAATRESALRTVQAIVAPVCLRRAKNMLDPVTGTQLVELPEKVVEIRRVPFSFVEQEFYTYLYSRVRQSVENSVVDGVIGTGYTVILALLLRLRQACCHPLLLKSQNENQEDAKVADLDLTSGIDSFLEKLVNPPSVEYTAEFIKELVNSPLEEQECAICSEKQTDPMLTECLHSACGDCLMQHISYLRKKGGEAKCHICRQQIDVTRLFAFDSAAMKLRPVNNNMQSTKIRALIAGLRQDPPGKTVVFSQFTSFLDLIESHLREAGFPVYRFDGSMPQAQRAISVEQFQNDKHNNAVFLLSLKAGGVGLNLVVAKYAYLMDPWWSYAIEAQAIDRIHRLGQTDQVKIVRFIIEGSIEERMLKIQDRKRALSTLVTAEERHAQQLADIKLLLDLPERSDLVD